MHVLVTGAAGRIGRMLQVSWSTDDLDGLEPIWCVRQASSPAHLQWDILSGIVPPIPKGAVILHLAGVVRGDPCALAYNTEMALKVCDAAKAAGVPHVFIASSAAVYGRGSADLTESQIPHPVSDYGRAKLAMERQVLRWSQNAGAFAPHITCLRIGNIVGADALIGQAVAGRHITLDSIAGHSGGPVRSYIGPGALAYVLAQLVRSAGLGKAMPKILNIATQPPVFMADLLKAAKLPFQFAPPETSVLAKVCLSTARLAGLADLPSQSPDDLIADWRSLGALTP